MKNKVSLLIGIRYLRAQRRNHFISFISLVSIIGMTLGVAVLILVLSVMNGADRELKHRILGTVPHVILKGADPFEDWQTPMKTALDNKRVIAAAPYYEVQAMLTRAGQVSPTMTYGIDPALEGDVSIISRFTQNVSLDDLKPGEFGIILGSRLAQTLGAATGDKVTLIVPQASVTMAGVLPRLKRFKVIGTFEVGAELDSHFAYIHIADAGVMMQTPGKVQGVRLKVDDLFEARQVAQTLVNKMPNLLGYDWTFTHGTLFQAIKMEKTMMALLLFLIVAVAIFNILSTLVMLVTEKKSDIAILMTMGASPQQIRNIFLVQGSCIGGFGALLGGILGTIAALTISDLFKWIEQILHKDLFSAYFIDYLPSYLVWQDVVWVTAISFILSIVATWYPASRAANIDPVEALRYE